MADLLQSVDAWAIDKEKEYEALIKIQAILKGFDTDAIQCMLWKIAEKNDIVIVQTFTSEHLDNKQIDAARIHKALSHTDLIVSEARDVVKKIIKEIEDDDAVDESDGGTDGGWDGSDSDDS